MISRWRGWLGNRKKFAYVGGALLIVAVIAAAHQAKSLQASAQESQALSPADVERCSALQGQHFDSVTVENTKSVAAGDKAGRNLFGSEKTAVPFCFVQGTGSSGPGSTIHVEMYLPANWNGKLLGVGGGGLSGGLTASTGSLVRELPRGYAGVANDAGHTDEKKAAWGIGAPARIEDFGFKANHVALVAAKAAVAAYYGKAAERSYFSGCSNGGRDALMLAQRYPHDYDGIVAGAPANNWNGLMASFLTNHQLLERTPGAQKLASKLEMVRKFVMRKCDMLDGVADDVLENPLACRFDPAELQCSPGKKTDCLSKGEVSVMRAIYQGPHTQDGKRIIAGYPVGSEYGKSILPLVGWAPWFMSWPKAGLKLSADYFRGLVAQDLEWDPETFDLERDYQLAKDRTGAAMDALDPDLHGFIEHGGKLILFQGWEDAAIPAGNTLEYYAAVRERVGTEADSSVRLFMAPGMAHCSLGHGPDIIDPVAAIDGWVSSGNAPETILASKLDSNLAKAFGLSTKIVRTRPLCAWPKTAHYKGSGSTDAAENFVCADQTSQ